MIVSGIWKLLPLLIISSSRVFSEDNICSRMENYTVTSMETYTEPVVVNTFTWCLQIPPRCPKTRTEMRQRHRLKTELKTRRVSECCEGYKMIASSDEELQGGIVCSPSCEKCLSGVCVSPNRCQCIPGFHGDHCDTKCPPGTWGSECREKCNCTEDVSCNPVNGQCVCPQGLRGPVCREMGIDKAVTDLGIGQRGTNYSRISGTTESKTEDDREMVATTDYGGTTTTETTNSIPETVSTSVQTEVRVEESGSSSTARPVIVLVSVPERRRNLDKVRGFAMKNPFVGQVDDNHLHDIGPPKPDYVKNIHKDIQPSPIPLDIALIVVASIVSLGLTSMAVVMVLHMRSKLLEAARISIYEEGKPRSHENSNSTKIASIATGTLPETPLRLGPTFAPSGPIAVSNTGNIDPSCNYANGTASIGLRLSGNLHGFVQDDHYDRPPATRMQLLNDFDTNTEHVYDEIPLQSSPLSCYKNA